MENRNRENVLNKEIERGNIGHEIQESFEDKWENGLEGLYEKIKKRTVGVALKNWILDFRRAKPGGGVHGFNLHLGILQYLDEQKIKKTPLAENTFAELRKKENKICQNILVSIKKLLEVLPDFKI